MQFYCLKNIFDLLKCSIFFFSHSPSSFFYCCCCCVSLSLGWNKKCVGPFHVIGSFVKLHSTWINENITFFLQFQTPNIQQPNTYIKPTQTHTRTPHIYLTNVFNWPIARAQKQTNKQLIRIFISFIITYLQKLYVVDFFSGWIQIENKKQLEIDRFAVTYVRLHSAGSHI